MKTPTANCGLACAAGEWSHGGRTVSYRPLPTAMGYLLPPFLRISFTLAYRHNRWVCSTALCALYAPCANHGVRVFHFRRFAGNLTCVIPDELPAISEERAGLRARNIRVVLTPLRLPRGKAAHSPTAIPTVRLRATTNLYGALDFSNDAYKPVPRCRAASVQRTVFRRACSPGPFTCAYDTALPLLAVGLWRYHPLPSRFLLT